MDTESITRQVSEPLYNSRKWMRFASIVLILQGVFSVFSIWGIIVCWIPIWMAVLLRSAANSITTAFETDDTQELKTTMEKLGKYFRIFGTLLLVMIVVFIIGFLAAILIPLFAKARQAALEAGAQ
jgi:ABC-type phosphate transport system permease subunit